MVRYTLGGIVRRFGMALVFSAAAHYGLHLLEPLAERYLHPDPPGQRLPSPALRPIEQPTVYAPPHQKPLEELLAEAVYVP